MPHVKAFYNPSTGKIEYQPIYSIKGDAIRKKDINRIGGYMNVFTHENDRDLSNEFFDKTTDFMDDFGWGMVGKPILINHGMDGAFKSMHVGVFDFENEDDIGRYVEGRLFEQKDYEDMLRSYSKRKGLGWSDSDILKKAELAYKTVQAFFSTNKAHFSSGALPQEVTVNPENGHIKRWPRIEGSATLTPAEPDGTEITAKAVTPNFEYSLKTAFEMLDAILDETLSEQTAQPAREGSNPIEQEADKQIDTPSRKSQNKGNKAMELREWLASLIASAQELLGGMGESPEAAASMADEVVDELKAEAEALPEEEKAKAMDEELVKAWTAKLFAKAEAKHAKNLQLKSSADNALKSQLDAWKANQPANPSAQQGMPRFTGGNSRIEVGNNLKYSHLSASDMALGILMQLAPAKQAGLRPKLNDVVSEEYLKNFAAKAYKYAESEPYGRKAISAQHLQMGMQANAVIKSIMPFKANELDASNIAGQGDEWVSEWWSTDLWERERFERHYDKLVARGMMVQTIPQGADTAHFPTEGSDPVAYVAPQANSVSSTGMPEVTANFSPFGTGKVDCTPLEIKIATSVTVILDEDSIINASQNANRQLNEAALETRDKLLVNGDDSLGTTNINYDGTQVPLGLSRPYYTASDGFRLHGLSNSNAVDASNTLSLETYRLTLAEMDGELRQYYERMVFMIDPTTEMASLAIPEIKTDDVRRSFATVSSGRILNLFGVDVIVNGFIPQTDTDGKVTATGNVANRGTILLIYAPYWGFAYKRQITLETQRNIYSGTNDYVLGMRIGMVARGANASALSYNVATTVS